MEILPAALSLKDQFGEGVLLNPTLLLDGQVTVVARNNFCSVSVGATTASFPRENRSGHCSKDGEAVVGFPSVLATMIRGGGTRNPTAFEGATGSPSHQY